MISVVRINRKALIRSLFIGVYIAAVLLAVNAAALATQPSLLVTSVESLAESGNARQISCRLSVYNPNPTPVIVESPSFASPLGYSVALRPSSFSLGAGQRLSVDMLIWIDKDGKFQVLVPITVKDSSGRTQMGTSRQDIYFRVTGGRYTVSNFRSLFVNPYARETDDEGKQYQMFRTGPRPAGWPDSAEFRTLRTDVEELERMSRDTVFTTDWSDRGSGFKDGSVRADLVRASFIRPVGSLLPPTATAKGTLVYTGADMQIHPAYGWRVVVYLMYNGNKIKLTETKTKFNGYWEVSIPIYFPIDVTIEYQPRNRFFSFADVSDNTYYSFSSGTVYHLNSGSVANEFTQTAYTASSDLINLGELYNDGMILWDQLKRKGRGISPLRDESIVVYYPNDEYDCERENEEPWSCSATNGMIWLIPQHAAGRAVMIHELAHQIHYEYWSNLIPGGGEHPPMACTTRGSALTEGFADYMVHWARFKKSDVPAGPDTQPIENPVGACTFVQSANQMWVSATFWDLYDTIFDGDDIFNFANEGAVIGVFLQQSGVLAPDMPSMLGYYMQASPANVLTLAKIYEQNHQDINP